MITGAEVKGMSEAVHLFRWFHKKISVTANYEDSIQIQNRASARMLEVKNITTNDVWSTWKSAVDKADAELKELEREKERLSHFPANLNVKKRCGVIYSAHKLHATSKLLDSQAIKSSRESRIQYTKSASGGLHPATKDASKDAPPSDGVRFKQTRHTQPRHKQTQPKHTRYKPRKYIRHSRPRVIVNVINLPSGPIATTVSDVTGVGKKIGADAVRILEDFSARTQADGAGSLTSDSISMTESVVSEFTEVLDDVASVISSGALTAQSTSSLAIVDDIVSLIDS